MGFPPSNVRAAPSNISVAGEKPCSCKSSGPLARNSAEREGIQCQWPSFNIATRLPVISTVLRWPYSLISTEPSAWKLDSIPLKPPTNSSNCVQPTSYAVDEQNLSAA